MSSATTQLATALPPQRTKLIGREAELHELLEALAAPNRRLVTLTGPGGIGKTTLAVAAARRFAEGHAKDVTFVALDAVPSADRLAVALTDGLGILQLGQADPRERLLEVLRDQDRLLVLDNFEHLLEGVDLVAEILDAAPEIRLLVTSREALNLRDEWRFAVAGLPVPEEGTAVSESAAVELFAQRAVQARSDFSLAREEADTVRICRLVEGAPLALELAASWAATLSCAEIADEIERSIDFLESSLRDVPARHRSIRAVFEQSWERLSEEERQVFQRLSVFRGGFDRRAALHVAGGNLAVLASLADKSLVRADASGRIRLHEMLRQCAEEKLVTSQAAVDEARDAHCSYYMDFLTEQGRLMEQGAQLEAAAAIGAEFDNVLAAWQCALEGGAAEMISATSFPFSMFGQFKGRYAEGYDAFVAAVERLRGLEPTPSALTALALCLVEAGWFAVRLGRIAEAKEILTECLELHDDGKVSHVPGFSTEPRTALGVIALIEGDYQAAATFASEALRIGEEAGDDWTAELALYALTTASAASGQLEDAREHGLRAYDIARAKKDRWFMAYCLNELGSIAVSLGDFDQAEEYYKASYDLRREFGDPEGMAVALNRLGDLAMLAGDQQQAADQYRRAMAIYRDINDQGGLADSFRGLANSSLATGSHRQAARYYREALEIADAIGHIPMTLSVLAGAADLLVQSGRDQLGCALLALIQDHPSADRETAERARERLTVCATAPLPKSLELPDAMRSVCAEMIGLEEHAAATAADDAFVEPLTEREREVLERIADGRSNSEIAEELVVSIGTVKAHTGNIYSKLGVHNRVQAMSRAKEVGLLPAD